MKCLLILSIFLAVTISAFAYTYTCQEGHFQIDVPEGWEKTGNNEGGLIHLIPPDRVRKSEVLTGGFYNIVIRFGAWGSACFKQLSFGDKLRSVYSITKLHNEELTATKTGYPDMKILKDIQLGKSECSVLRIDEGYIFEYDPYPGDYTEEIQAVFRKKEFLYIFWAGMDKTEENEFIGILNSFRALD